MPRTSSDAYLSIEARQLLQANDNDDQILDLILEPALPYEYPNNNADSENELNILIDDECYPVVDEDNISFGTRDGQVGAFSSHKSQQVFPEST